MPGKKLQQYSAKIQNRNNKKSCLLNTKTNNLKTIVETKKIKYFSDDSSIIMTVKNKTLDDSNWKDSFDRLLGPRSPLRKNNIIKKNVRLSYNLDSSVNTSNEKSKNPNIPNIKKNKYHMKDKKKKKNDQNISILNATPIYKRKSFLQRFDDIINKNEKKELKNYISKQKKSTVSSTPINSKNGKRKKSKSIKEPNNDILFMQAISPIQNDNSPKINKALLRTFTGSEKKRVLKDFHCLNSSNLKTLRRKRTLKAKRTILNSFSINSPAISNKSNDIFELTNLANNYSNCEDNNLLSSSNVDHLDGWENSNNIRSENVIKNSNENSFKDFQIPRDLTSSRERILKNRSRALDKRGSINNELESLSKSLSDAEESLLQLENNSENLPLSDNFNSSKNIGILNQSLQIIEQTYNSILQTGQVITHDINQRFNSIDKNLDNLILNKSNTETLNTKENNVNLQNETSTNKSQNSNGANIIPIASKDENNKKVTNVFENNAFINKLKFLQNCIILSGENNKRKSLPSFQKCKVENLVRRNSTNCISTQTNLNNINQVISEIQPLRKSLHKKLSEIISSSNGSELQTSLKNLTNYESNSNIQNLSNNENTKNISNETIKSLNNNKIQTRHSISKLQIENETTPHSNLKSQTIPKPKKILKKGKSENFIVNSKENNLILCSRKSMSSIDIPSVPDLFPLKKSLTRNDSKNIIHNSSNLHDNTDKSKKNKFSSGKSEIEFKTNPIRKCKANTKINKENKTSFNNEIKKNDILSNNENRPIVLQNIQIISPFINEINNTSNSDSNSKHKVFITENESIFNDLRNSDMENEEIFLNESITSNSVISCKAIESDGQKSSNNNNDVDSIGSTSVKSSSAKNSDKSTNYLKKKSIDKFNHQSSKKTISKDQIKQKYNKHIDSRTKCQENVVEVKRLPVRKCKKIKNINNNNNNTIIILDSSIESVENDDDNKSKLRHCNLLNQLKTGNESNFEKQIKNLSDKEKQKSNKLSPQQEEIQEINISLAQNDILDINEEIDKKRKKIKKSNYKRSTQSNNNLDKHKKVKTSHLNLTKSNTSNEISAKSRKLNVRKTRYANKSIVDEKQNSIVDKNIKNNKKSINNFVETIAQNSAQNSENNTLSSIDNSIIEISFDRDELIKNIKNNKIDTFLQSSVVPSHLSLSRNCNSNNLSSTNHNTKSNISNRRSRSYNIKNSDILRNSVCNNSLQQQKILSKTNSICDTLYEDEEMVNSMPFVLSGGKWRRSFFARKRLSNMSDNIDNSNTISNTGLKQPNKKVENSSLNNTKLINSNVGIRKSSLSNAIRRTASYENNFGNSKLVQQSEQDSKATEKIHPQFSRKTLLLEPTDDEAPIIHISCSLFNTFEKQSKSFSSSTTTGAAETAAPCVQLLQLPNRKQLSKEHSQKQNFIEKSLQQRQQQKPPSSSLQYSEIVEETEEEEDLPVDDDSSEHNQSDGDVEYFNDRPKTLINKNNTNTKKSNEIQKSLYVPLRTTAGNHQTRSTYQHQFSVPICGNRQSVSILGQPSNRRRRTSFIEGFVDFNYQQEQRFLVDNFIKQTESRTRSSAWGTERRNHLQNSFEEKLICCPTLDVSLRAQLSPRDILLRRCNQTDPFEFSSIYSESELLHCRKIGEGVYGEVFMNKNQNGEAIVLKIIPIEGLVEINGEVQKNFEQILPEIIIAEELSRLRNDKKSITSGFVEVKNVHCVQGCYPDNLIDLWELYRDNCGTENDHPEIFPEDQLYIVLELANAGQDLEAFHFQNALQSHSALLQVALSLAVAEEKFKFEHRDLHWGNILLSSTDQKEIYFKLNDKDYKIPTHGVKATIIDYTLSRMIFEGCCLYNDLSNDNELFSASGDYQFDVYRSMQKRLDNQWERYDPYTNILWLHYTIDKMISGARYRCSKTKKHRSAIQTMMKLRDELLDYNSASDYVESFDD